MASRASRFTSSQHLLPSASAVTDAWGGAFVLLTHLHCEHLRQGVVGAYPCEDDGMSTGTGLRVRASQRRRGPAGALPPSQRRQSRSRSRPPSTAARASAREVVFEIRDMSVHYGESQALGWTSLSIYRNLVTAVIGPSGCGKSTFIRSLNRMNDSIPGFKLSGQVLYHGHDVYAAATTAWRFGVGSGWCSRSRTRFRSRSTTTSPGPRGISACDPSSTSASNARFARGAVG